MWFTITLTDNRVVRCYDDHVRDHKDTLEPELENDDDWLSQAMRSPTPTEIVPVISTMRERFFRAHIGNNYGAYLWAAWLASIRVTSSD